MAPILASLFKRKHPTSHATPQPSKSPSSPHDHDPHLHRISVPTGDSKAAKTSGAPQGRHVKFPTSTVTTTAPNITSPTSEEKPHASRLRAVRSMGSLFSGSGHGSGLDSTYTPSPDLPPLPGDPDHRVSVSQTWSEGLNGHSVRSVEGAGAGHVRDVDVDPPPPTDHHIAPNPPPAHVAVYLSIATGGVPVPVRLRLPPHDLTASVGSAPHPSPTRGSGEDMAHQQEDGTPDPPTPVDEPPDPPGLLMFVEEKLREEDADGDSLGDGVGMVSLGEMETEHAQMQSAQGRPTLTIGPPTTPPRSPPPMSPIISRTVDVRISQDIAQM